MHDGAPLSWREVVEKHQTALAAELTSRLDVQIRQAVSDALEVERKTVHEQVERVRRETAEWLNQGLRRLRQTSVPQDTFELLAEASAPCAGRVVVLSFENNQAIVSASRGLSSDRTVASFPVDLAPAIASAIASKDPLVTIASDTQISASLARAFDAGTDQRAYLFPILDRQNVRAMLLASGNVKPAPLEVLAEAVGLKVEAFAAQTSPGLSPLLNPGVVNIAGSAVPDSATGPRRTWDELSPEDQKLHLQAQRLARVRVAEIRLYHAEAFRKGVAASDIYGALSPEIEAARTELLQSFLLKSSTMVDYLHLEILRSLAHDDISLLGQKYPGPMV